MKQTFKCPVCEKQVKVSNAGMAETSGILVSVGKECERKIRASRGLGIKGCNGKTYK